MSNSADRMSGLIEGAPFVEFCREEERVCRISFRKGAGFVEFDQHKVEALSNEAFVWGAGCCGLVPSASVV